MNIKHLEIEEIDYKSPSNTKQMNRVRNLRIKYGNSKLSYVLKYK